MRHAACILIIAVMMLCSGVMAAVIRVPIDQPTIQAGIDAAIEGDTVLVADGTYTGEGNRDIDFKGKAITVASENGAQASVIDCQGTEQENHRGFVFHSGETLASVLRGFTVKNGFLIGDNDGGGVNCVDSSPTISNCTISNNRAEFKGGGIHCANSSPMIIECSILNNTSERFGGGIDIGDMSPMINNCIVSENSATTGAGICIQWGSPAIANTDISRNSAGRSGGGIFLRYTSASISRCRISKNSDYLSSGGIYCLESTVSISECSVEDNTSIGMAEYWAGIGGLNCNVSTMTMSNSRISGNTGLYCGGLYLRDAAATITNCVVFGNSGEYANGLNIGFSSVMMSSSTIYENRIVQSSGHGIDTYGSDVNFLNCIIWDNGYCDICEVTNYDSNIKLEYSNIKDLSYSGIGNIHSAPQIIGGDPLDLHLSPKSPCIDSGTDTGETETDVDGNPRLQGGAVDMGAYEYPGWPSVTRTYITMPAHAFIPGDTVSCSVSVWNADTSIMKEYPLFVILDVLGSYYCAPSYTEFDHFVWTFNPGLTDLTILPEFTWPDGVGSASGIIWYAALVNPEMTELVSEIGVFDFGWSER